MPLGEPYRQAIDEAFPAPVQAVAHARFHIVAHANKALNDVRKNEVRHLAQEGRRDLKGLRQAPLFREENLPERYKASISALKASYLRTAKGCALKENPRRCWDHRLEPTARKHILAWIRRAKRSGLRPFQRVGSMIADRHRQLLHAPYHERTTRRDGLQAHAVIRAGRDYRHHGTFRMTALFFLGGLD